MYIKFCDRCKRTTKNGPAFLIPTNKEHGAYQIDGAWFGDPVVLCNNCLMDFDEFRYIHSNYNHFLDDEDSIDYLQKEKEMKEKKLCGTEFNTDN